MECCDPELAWLYRLPRIDWLLRQGQAEEAQEEMNFFKGKINEMTVRHKYHYNHNEGLLLSRDLNYEEAMKFFEKSSVIAENNDDFAQILKDRPISNIGGCYTEMNYPNAAIIFLEAAIKESPKSRVDFFYFYTSLSLALSYAKVGIFRNSEQHLKESIEYVESTGNEPYIGLVFYTAGKVYHIKEDWDKAIESLNEALNYLGVGSEYYNWSFWYKLLCAIEKEDYQLSSQMLKEAKDLGIDADEMLIPFKHLSCFRNVHKGKTQPKEEDVEYMLNVSIPYFLARHYKFLAIRAYELIIEHYEATKQPRKADKIFRLLNEVRKSLHIVVV